MTLVSEQAMGITDEFVAKLAERAADAEQQRRIPAETMADFTASGLSELLVPARYGGQQAAFPEILDPVRRMAHGCTSSAWTLSFYTLHNWIMALFGEEAQREAFADRPFLAPATLAPTGRALLTPGGYRVSGRWSWATGIMDANWVMVSALAGPNDALFPALMLLPAADVEVVDVWHTDGMRATGSNDIVVNDVFVPTHRALPALDIYKGDSPGARLHDVPTYRWPMVPALALVAAMPVLGTAERVTELYTERLHERVMAYEGVKQKDKPAARARLGDARVRLEALRALIDRTAERIETMVRAGEHVSRAQRADARLSAAHVAAESRAIIGNLLEASGGSVHFLDNPLQRAKRDVDTVTGHIVFEHDTCLELAGALAIGMKVPPTSMI